MRIITRSPAYAAALALAGAAVLAAPAAAQASAALPGLAVVPCSSSALAAAISQANSTSFAALVLARGCTYVLTTPAAPNDGLPPVTGNLLVLGSGGTTISRSSSAAFRIFHVAAGGRLTLANVTVANGEIDLGDGGGILDQGTLVLRNVRLTGNTGGLGGGLAVLSGAHARISNSELDGNGTSPTGAGGAVYNEGDLVIDRSALARNTADFFGGGVFTQVVQPTATTRISRTVITRNRAGRIGGGIFNEGATVLTGDRVVSNSAGSGGGIFSSGTITLRFTLVAFNSPDNCVPRGTIRGCRN
jgi:predicted outer membrane repeat protein